MHAMILAAGRGERMRPLTNSRPKSMLYIREKPLIQHQVERLVAAGIRDIVINYGRFGEQIEAWLGDGSGLGANILYSPERDQLLDTGGGIRKALPLLGADPFIAINADIWIEFELANLRLQESDLAHLVMVDNPPHHPEGDFVLKDSRLLVAGDPKLTFSGLGIYRPDLFRHAGQAAFPLGPLLREAMQEQRVSGEHYRGRWIDIGTPERLQEARRLFE